MSAHTHEDARPTFGCLACIEDRDLGKQFATAHFIDAFGRVECDVEECEERAVIVVPSEEYACEAYLCREHAQSTIYNDDGEVAR